MPAKKPYRFKGHSREIGRVTTGEKPGWYLDASNEYRWRPWILGHLNGERPDRHPTTIVWRNGKHPQVEVDQVWVNADGLLVTITDVGPSEKTITYVYYKCSCCDPKTVSYGAFRNSHKLWEEKVTAGKMILRSLAREVARGCVFKTLEDAARYYGLDPKTGIRVA